MLDWYFRKKEPGETIREPVQGEFFATDAISDPGMALVREGIQNALDAGTKTNGAVMVRIFVSGDEKAVPKSKAERFFGAAWSHYNSDGCGIRPDSRPDPDKSCNFIAFEDFQTCGLEGNPEEAFKPSQQGSKNHFYHFFRAEGQSDKDASDRGSWGVGKHVFVRSSRLNTIFGLTVRAGDAQRMLMGKAVLKSHAIGDERDCRYQDGYFGLRKGQEDKFVLPTTDREMLDEFANLFDLQRGSSPGLSIVIPWPDPEITDRALVSAVLRDYFYPILTGQLEVIVETPSVTTSLDANSLLPEAMKLDQQYAAELKPLIELVEWSKTVGDDVFLLKAPDPDRAWQWDESLLTESQLIKLRAAYHGGEKIAVRVPVTVRPSKGDNAQSFFDVYFARDNSEGTGIPTFIREGIIISRAGAPRTHGVRALVVVHDLPLAAFLRAAENPSHTEWQHIRLRDDYKFGYKTDLDFVRRSVHELVRIVTAAEREEDPTLLSDYFSIPLPPEEDDAEPTPRQTPKEDTGTQPPAVTSPPPTSPRFRIHKINGGFAILPAGVGVIHPEILEIRVAYDIRHGNPLRRYNSADFELDKIPIRLDPVPRNVEVLERTGNRVVIAIRDPDYAFHVAGFDERRELYVRAVPREVTDDSSPT